MRATTSASTRSMPLVTSRLATPPPWPMLDLRDGDTVVGWIHADAFGFRGFGDEAEAAHAAWVAYRTMTRRFARETGRRPLPIDTQPMSLQRSGDVELILASGRPIGTLVRPGPDSRSGAGSFGFELRLPVPADELTMRSTAYLVYRTLRRSGIRWALWMPDPEAAPAPGGALAADAAPARAADAAPATTRSAESRSLPGAAAATPPAARGDAPGSRATGPIYLAVLIVVAMVAMRTSSIVQLLGGVATLIAFFAVASLVRLVVTDVRDALRRGERPSRPAPLDGRRARIARRATSVAERAWGLPRASRSLDDGVRRAASGRVPARAT